MLTPSSRSLLAPKKVCSFFVIAVSLYSYVICSLSCAKRRGKLAKQSLFRKNKSSANSYNDIHMYSDKYLVENSRRGKVYLSSRGFRGSFTRGFAHVRGFVVGGRFVRFCRSFTGILHRGFPGCCKVSRRFCKSFVGVSQKFHDISCRFRRGLRGFAEVLRGFVSLTCSIILLITI